MHPSACSSITSRCDEIQNAALAGWSVARTILHQFVRALSLPEHRPGDLSDHLAEDQMTLCALRFDMAHRLKSSN
jgi:hypothetical protein